MRVLTITELAGFTARELMSIYQQVGKQLPGTRMCSARRLAIEQTLANIRFVLARRHRAPH